MDVGCWIYAKFGDFNYFLSSAVELIMYVHSFSKLVLFATFYGNFSHSIVSIPKQAINNGSFSKKKNKNKKAKRIKRGQSWNNWIRGCIFPSFSSTMEHCGRSFLHNRLVNCTEMTFQIFLRPNIHWLCLCYSQLKNLNSCSRTYERKKLEQLNTFINDEININQSINQFDMCVCTLLKSKRNIFRSSLYIEYEYSPSNKLKQMP